MILYLVRHAQSAANAGVPDAGADSDLTELGVQQAASVGSFLAVRGVDRVLTSPFLRTLRTAQAICTATGATGEVCPALREHHVEQPFPLPPAPWPLLSGEAIAARLPGLQVPKSYGDEASYPVVEADAAVQARVASFLDQLRADYAAQPEARLVLVTHGSPSEKLALSFLGLRWKDGFRTTHGNASVTILARLSQIRLK